MNYSEDEGVDEMTQWRNYNVAREQSGQTQIKTIEEFRAAKEFSKKQIYAQNEKTQGKCFFTIQNQKASRLIQCFDLINPFRSPIALLAFIKSRKIWAVYMWNRRVTWVLQTLGLFAGLTIYIILDVVDGNKDYATSLIWGVSNAVFTVLDFHFN